MCVAGQLPSSPRFLVARRQNTFGALGTSATGLEWLLDGLSAGGQGWGPTLKVFAPDAQIYVVNEQAPFCWALGASKPVLYKQTQIPNNPETC